MAGEEKRQKDGRPPVRNLFFYEQPTRKITSGPAASKEAKCFYYLTCYSAMYPQNLCPNNNNNLSKNSF